MVFLDRHQGYLSLGVGSPVLKQVASVDRAIGICNTVNRHNSYCKAIISRAQDRSFMAQTTVWSANNTNFDNSMKSGLITYCCVPLTPMLQQTAQHIIDLYGSANYG